MISRVTWSEGGGFELIGGSQPKQADNALMLFHKIMIYVLGAQIDHFKNTIDEKTVMVLLDDFVAIWKAKEGGESDPKKEKPQNF